LTVITPGTEAAAVASAAIGILEMLQPLGMQSTPKRGDPAGTASPAVAAVKHWGVQTLGEFAALPAADLVARLGREALAWQAAARGGDLRPLVPTLDAERFNAELELEWPIEGIEPLSFVLTRLLEPLSTRLERRDRGAAVLHVLLRLVSKDVHARRLELPTPMRDVRALRTLALLDLESHPPAAAIDGVMIVIDPTPGRIVQHALFTRAQPTPEQISTLVARLGALMGQDRLGAPATVDTYCPGAFAMQPFATDHETRPRSRGDVRDMHERSAHPADSAAGFPQALRRCRQPVPARVAVGAEGRPVRVTTDRRGLAGGAVVQCVGPWKTSGNWWSGASADHQRPVLDSREGYRPSASRQSQYWNRDEWDVAIADGAVYRIFKDCISEQWFIDAIVD
jgi:protein ImuB